MLDKLKLSEHTVEANGVVRVNLVLNKATAIMDGTRLPVVALAVNKVWAVVENGRGWKDENLGPGGYYFVQIGYAMLEVEPGCLTE